MNVLDSPLEALAFNYLSFGSLTLLNNLWTWLALITAGLSLWRIRSANCSKPEPQTPSRPDPVAEVLTLAPDAVTVTAAVTEAPCVKEKVGNGVVDEDFDGVRKGKFTVYYEEDEVQCRCGENDKEEGLLTATVTEEWEEESEWWVRWERLLRLRNGDNEQGWYTCQDLTVLNGNVVRLWDGGLRFGGNGSGTFTRESWYSYSSCIHVW